MNAAFPAAPAATQTSPPDRLTALLDELSALPDKQARGRTFEDLCEWMLRHTSFLTGGATVKDVRRFLDWPRCWHDREIGTDLIADLIHEDGSEEVIAVQCKGYAPTTRVRKADIDSFLADTNRPEVSRRLLIASTDLGLGDNARVTAAGQEKPLHLIGLGDLLKEQVDWPSRLDDLRPPRPILKDPLPHQLRALQEIVDGLADKPRGQAVMACGSGKTLVGLWAAEALASRRVVVFVPTLALVSQVRREWTANASVRVRWLVVCSDDKTASIDTRPASDEDADHLVEDVEELAEAAVTTDPGQVAEFLSRAVACEAPSAPDMRVVFCTYHSSVQLAAAQARHGAPPFDLAVCDEAHRLAGATGSLFATVLDGRRVRAHKRLFMTATPRYLTGRAKRGREAGELDAVDMDDEDVFGPVLHRLSFGEAIGQGLLSDYRVAITVVSDDRAHRLARDATPVIVDGRALDARTLAIQATLAEAMRKHGLERLLTFHRRVRKAKQFAEYFPHTLAQLPTRRRPLAPVALNVAVSGDMGSRRRDRALDAFRALPAGRLGVVSNVRCLTEGIDVPAIDAVAFCDPVRSQVDILQAVGRVIRKHGDKTGFVLVPVLLQPGEEAELALERGAFNDVWRVLSALRAHDERLAADLDRARADRARLPSGRERAPKQVTVLGERLPRGFLTAFAHELVEHTTASFEEYLARLEQFRAEHRHAVVPVDFVTDDGVKLGSWVSVQRLKYRRGTLATDREDRLRDVDGWEFDPLEADWQRALNVVRDYTVEHGHAPQQGLVIDGVEVGRWVAKRRNEYRKARLTPDRVAALEAIDGWQWDVWRGDADWMAHYEKLRSFADEHGHARPDRDTPLGEWVVGQRRRRERVSPDRQDVLDALPGWAWTGSDAAWEEKFEELRAFAHVNGHVGATQTTALGRWVAQQRLQRNQGKLSADRMAHLERDVPHWAWKPGNATSQAHHDKIWQSKLRELRSYATENGHARPPQSTQLGKWVSTQRTQRNKGKLRADRETRLTNEVPYWEWKPVKGQHLRPAAQPGGRTRRIA